MEAYYRACWVCSSRFVVCRERGFNRRYCEEECAAVARWQSKRMAQEKYRSDPEVWEQHVLDQREYRRRKKAAKERVVDQLSRPGDGAGMVAGVIFEESRSMDTVAAGEQGGTGTEGWTLIVAPELLAEAEGLAQRGESVRCVCCGRVAHIVRVVGKAESPWLQVRRTELRKRLEVG